MKFVGLLVFTLFVFSFETSKAQVTNTSNNTDEHGCKKSEGYAWSVLKKDCIKISEHGTLLKFRDKSISAILLFNEEQDTAELFISNEKTSIILPRKKKDTIFLESIYSNDIYKLSAKHLKYVLSKNDIDICTYFGETIILRLDKYGCNLDKGYSWSVLKNECVKPWEVGVKLNPLNYNSPFVNLLFNEKQDKAELFFRYENKSVILNRNASSNLFSDSVYELTTDTFQYILKKEDKIINEYYGQTITGNDSDNRGCSKSSGYRWSELKKDCILPKEITIQMVNLDGSLDVAILVSNTKDQAELFISDEKTSVLLERIHLAGQTESYSNKNYELSSPDGNQWILKENGAIICQKEFHFDARRELDEYGCKKSHGYIWSNLKKECIKTWEVGIGMQSPDSTLNVAVLFNDTKDKAEIFLRSFELLGLVLIKERTPDGTHLYTSHNYKLSSEDGKHWVLKRYDIVLCQNDYQSTLKTDKHGCSKSDAYYWSNAENKCIRPFDAAGWQLYPVGDNPRAAIVTGNGKAEIFFFGQETSVVLPQIDDSWVYSNGIYSFYQRNCTSWAVTKDGVELYTTEK